MKTFALVFFLSQYVLSTQAVIRVLTSQTFFRGIEDGRFDVIGDSRSAEDYNREHIANVTHLELLHLAGRPNQKATPEDLEGCEFCHIVLYSTDGNRAQEALQILEDAGFKNLYNGLGVVQWAAAGFPLVTRSENVVPPCTTSRRVSAQCEERHQANNPTAPAPVRAPIPTVRPPAPATAPVRPPSPSPPVVPVKKVVPKDPLKDALKIASATDISRGSLNRRRVRGD
ncbi:hypothetical protein FisN_7Lh046 [Fistulifera solaris]|uniref:Rhodanese domain-containing protein n=1 Tax=Fistulifera solaris TaxID=1519565 RepID=A0A1Z5JD29_FISSO|nr:hypothetical protein FisN_7Lh046 [Fistulifera solaris]|eukprot:GAX11678.1 hypothetical protein FisN_7Lh046 [Fistulifera solaris]